MRKLLLALIGIIFGVTIAFTPRMARCETSKEVKSITFDKGNYFAITSIFDEVLLEDFTRKVMTYDGKELFIYFNSPGGSVFAMTRMIGVMKSSNIKFTCVARFAASAAFALFQACTERYILDDGIIMQHNAAGGFSGEFPRIKTLFEAVEAVVTAAEQEEAKRMKMSYADFKIAINNNLWLSKVTAAKYNAIDGVIEQVTCTKASIEEVIERNVTECSFFSCNSSVKKFSGCPLLEQEIISKDDKAKTPTFRNLKEETNPLKAFYHLAPSFRKIDN